MTAVGVTVVAILRLALGLAVGAVLWAGPYAFDDHEEDAS